MEASTPISRHSPHLTIGVPNNKDVSTVLTISTVGGLQDADVQSIRKTQKNLEAIMQ